jgi:hypothetical protein
LYLASSLGRVVFWLVTMMPLLRASSMTVSGHGLFELGDHLLGVPIREKVIGLDAQVTGRSYSTVVDHGAEGASWRTAGEEDDADPFADRAALDLLLYCFPGNFY